MSAPLTITKADLLAAVRTAADAAVKYFLASNDAEAIRTRLVEEVTCVSLAEVAALWKLTPRAAREALRKAKVAALDFGYRSPRYALSAVRAVVVSAAVKRRRTRVTIIEHPRS